MKNTIKTTAALFILICICLINNTTKAYSMIKPGGTDSTTTVLTINNLDTVYININQALVAGTTIDIPVSLVSDDVINALDFSFKYNQIELEYDTIINLTNYVQDLSYYNPNDSTVRFTSYSFTQPYTNDTALVYIRFNILSGVLCSTDLQIVDALLNGDAATNYVRECQFIGIAEQNELLSIDIYPNPTIGDFTVEAPSNTEFSLYTSSGKNIKNLQVGNSPMAVQFDLKGYSPGLYLLKCTNKSNIAYHRVILVD